MRSLMSSTISGSTNSKSVWTLGAVALASVAFFSFSVNMPPAAACPCGELKIPTKLPEDDPKSGLKFSKTSEYRKEFDTAIKDAKAACQKNIGQKMVAIVSDIDETLIDNRPFFEAKLTGPGASQASSSGFDWDNFSSWVKEAKAPTLKKTADFLAWARKNDFAIFLITGRQEKDRAGTILNLVRDKVAYDGLYMRPNGDKSPAEVMKTKHRKAIEEMGYHIIVNIGDQFSDLSGGVAVDCEKLPNKMYYVP